jgi:riboflavin synthase
MFTGIIECIASVDVVTLDRGNMDIWVKSPLSDELRIDQSVSHSGVCLTVVALRNGAHCVTAIAETLLKTNLGSIQAGSLLNIERCMIANGRFDGHVVQGHVDQVATCTAIIEQGGSWLYRFQYDATMGNIVVDKGSICVNGISLTCFDVAADAFSVAIIPYTYSHTNLSALRIGDMVNLEFDIIGKYVQRILKGRL